MKRKHKRSVRVKPDWKWITTIFGTTIGISGAMSFLSGEILAGGGLALSFVVLLGIVLIGILFDIIGVAVTAAEEKPFHSMAARKVPEAMVAIRLLRKADRVSSFCNDVVGDICGVISGSAAAVIAANAFQAATELETILQLVMSSLVAGVTVGGKAFGKSIAIGNCTAIVHTASKVICMLRAVPGAIGRLFRKQ